MPHPNEALVQEANAALGRRDMDAMRQYWVAAAHFNWLIVSIPLEQAMLLGDDEPATAAELDRYAEAGVRTFLSAYSERSDATDKLV